MCFFFHHEEEEKRKRGKRGKETIYYLSAQCSCRSISSGKRRACNRCNIIKIYIYCIILTLYFSFLRLVTNLIGFYFHASIHYCFYVYTIVTEDSCRYWSGSERRRMPWKEEFRFRIRFIFKALLRIWTANLYPETFLLKSLYKGKIIYFVFDFFSI